MAVLITLYAISNVYIMYRYNTRHSKHFNKHAFQYHPVLLIYLYIHRTAKLKDS